MSVKDQLERLDHRLKQLEAKDADVEPIGVYAELPALQPSGAPAIPGDIVTNTLSDLVGASWGNWDAVQAGMAANIEFEEVAGTRETVIRPKGFTIRADLGAISGAQQIVAEQFLAVRDRIVPELLSLQPLAVAVSPQQAAAAVQTTIDAIERIASAYTVLDGVNVQLADEAWQSLVGADPGDEDSKPSENPEYPNDGSLLSRLQKTFGFDRALVNTPDQETDYSRFLGIVNVLHGEYPTYRYHRPYFVESPDKMPYLGTQFRKLAVQLATLEQNTREFGGALTAIYIDPSEWESLTLETIDGRLNFGTYMRWLSGFPSKAQQALRVSGKEGAVALVPEAYTLLDATSAARTSDAAVRRNFPALYWKSPIVESTQSAVERTLIRILQALVPYTARGGPTIQTVVGPVSPPHRDGPREPGGRSSRTLHTASGLAVETTGYESDKYFAELRKPDEETGARGMRETRGPTSAVHHWQIGPEDEGERHVYLVSEETAEAFILRRVFIAKPFEDKGGGGQGTPKGTKK